MGREKLIRTAYRAGNYLVGQARRFRRYCSELGDRSARQGLEEKASMGDEEAIRTLTSLKRTEGSARVQEEKVNRWSDLVIKEDEYICTVISATDGLKFKEEVNQGNYADVVGTGILPKKRESRRAGNRIGYFKIKGNKAEIGIRKDITQESELVQAAEKYKDVRKI